MLTEERRNKAPWIASTEKAESMFYRCIVEGFKHGFFENIRYIGVTLFPKA
jgi:hypothetical protein